MEPAVQAVKRGEEALRFSRQQKSSVKVEATASQVEGMEKRCVYGEVETLDQYAIAPVNSRISRVYRLAKEGNIWRA